MVQYGATLYGQHLFRQCIVPIRRQFITSAHDDLLKLKLSEKEKFEWIRKNILSSKPIGIPSAKFRLSVQALMC